MLNNKLLDMNYIKSETNQIVNSESNSITSGYSADYINKRNTFASTEVFTGKYWTDGKKIYKKTIHTNRTSGSSLSYNVTFDSTGNINTIVSITGIVRRDSMGWSFYRVSDEDQYRYYISDYTKGKLEVTSGANFPGSYHQSDITIEYTKTSE